MAGFSSHFYLYSFLTIRTMKKLFIASALLVAAFWGQAQIQLGVHADGILASQTAKASGIRVSTGNRISWKAGLVANLDITEQISFMPQLNLLSKGSKFEFSQFGETYRQVTKLNYIELPLNF